MKTAARLGPGAGGRPLTLAAFLEGDYRRGYRYELIDGRLCASPLPDPPHDIVLEWIGLRLRLYSQDRPEVINFVTGAARVFVPGRKKPTCLQPDLTAYHDFPLHLPFRRVRWQENSPVLVIEVVSPDNADKDLVRNVELYFQIPSIREYWIFDTRDDAETPSLIVHRRHGDRRVERHISYGSTYTTRLLPGFELTVDPRR
jgi:Uma2 family endonuclease